MNEMPNQLSIFGDERPAVCCYGCQHFSEYKEPRTYAQGDGNFTVHGSCFKSYLKNGSYVVYPIYVPGGKCKDFKKKRGEGGR